MAESKESHLERTAHEPRDMTRHTVVLSDIRPVGQTLRVLRLSIPDGQPDIKFRPGQWVDTFCPGVPKAGGFTLTSAPSRAVSSENTNERRYLELAIRASPDNPPAQWLWQPADAILHAELQVRIGGSFVYPPLSLSPSPSPSPPPARVVFVAGGVGINPLMSMLSAIGEQAAAADAPAVTLLYGWREEEAAPLDDRDRDRDNSKEKALQVLFLDRIANLFAARSLQGTLRLFLTGDISKSNNDAVVRSSGFDIPCERRRITTADLDAAVTQGSTGPPADDIYVYVCGVPAMTDAFVEHLTAPLAKGGLGLAQHQVLFEKWW